MSSTPLGHSAMASAGGRRYLGGATAPGGGAYAWAGAPVLALGILLLTTSRPAVALLRPVLEPEWAAPLLFDKWEPRGRRKIT